jgi:hypothetical protein
MRLAATTAAALHFATNHSQQCVAVVFNTPDDHGRECQGNL